MRNALKTVLISAAVAVVATPALAAPTRIGGMYAETIYKNCGNNPNCIVSFTSLNKILHVTKVSCTFNFSNAGGATTSALELGVVTGTAFSPREYLAPMQLMNAGGGRAKFQLNTTTQTGFAVNTRPAVLIGFTQGANPAEAQCTISGKEQGS